MSLQRVVEEAIIVRKQLHTIAEPSWREFKTSAFLVAQLKQLGVTYRKCTETGLLVSLGVEAPGKHIGLRCDMDGLELTEANRFTHVCLEKDYMHACGHDGHMATMLAVVTWLKKYEKDLPGPVTCIFQPAEEGGHGAREMISEGALEGIDEIYGWHNWPAIEFGKAVCPPGPLMAANGSFEIDVLGRGGHASQPELCRDPVLAAAAITVGLQQLVSRRLAPQQSGVVSVTSIDGRSSETVIPDKVTLAGSVRMAATRDVEEVGRQIGEVARSIGAGHGTEVQVRYKPRYPAVDNDADSAGVMAGCLSSVLGEQWQCQTTAVPIMASEDFSYYLREVPGAFALVGAGDGGRFSIPCHNCRYDFNDRLIEPMVRILCRLVGLPDHW